MKLVHFILLGLIFAIVLMGARCNCTGTNCGTTPSTTISRASLTSSLKPNNEPVNNLEEVAAGTAVLYLAAEVSNPTKQTITQVTWLKLPNQVIATETFEGKRRIDLPQSMDFDETYNTSWLASQVRRPNSSWALGEYKAEIRLNNRLAKTVFFQVVADAQADLSAAKRSVRAVQTGDVLTDDNQLANTKTSFLPTADNIYIQLSLTNEQPGAKLQIGVQHLKTGLVIDSFSSVIGADLVPLFTLSRDRFNRLWPVGAYTVTVKVNDIIGRTANFTVQD